MSVSQGSSPGQWSFSPFPSFNLPLREPCCPNKLLATKRRTSLNKCNAEKNVVGEQILKRIKIYLKISQILLPSRPYQIKHWEEKKIIFFCLGARPSQFIEIKEKENNESSPLLTCSVHACPIVQSPKQLQGEDSSADFAWGFQVHSLAWKIGVWE